MKVFGISSRFRLLFPSPGQVSHVLRTRSPLGLPEQAPWTSFDLHVLSTPPAFILSQDQTLQQKRGRPSQPPKWVLEPATIVSERTIRVGKDSCGRCVLAVWPTRGTKLESTDNRVAAVRVDDSEIDRQFRDHPRVGAYCPHWRSVFSSVFKEPKLRHAP